MKKIIRLLIMVTVLFLFLVYIGKNIVILDLDLIRLDVGLIAAAYFFVQLALFMNIICIRFAFQILGVSTSFKTSYCIFFISSLGRYLPGRVWQLMSIGYIAKMNGIPYKKSILLFGFNQLLVLAINLIFSGIFLTMLSPRGTALDRIPLWAVSPVLIVIVFPNCLIQLLNLVLKIMRQPAIDLRIPYVYLIILICVYLLNAFFTGLGFTMLVKGLGLPINDKAFLMALYPLAYVVGYLTLIVPGGIGVREGVIVFLMKDLYSTGMASLVGVCALIWVISTEVVNSLVALWISDAAIFKKESARDTFSSTGLIRHM